MDRPEPALRSACEISILEEREWTALRARHEATVIPWIDAYRARRDRRETHPVHDFLFTYYQTNRQTLKRWRPMAHEALRGESADELLDDDRYTKDEYGVRLDVSKMDDGSRKRLRWAFSLINAAKLRPPRFNCFGLHEWAMIYRAKEIRHEKTPLRVSPEAVERMVEGNAIRCSHYDAFRFFTPEAAPLNELQPGREEREANEQFGCVHFNMDLYRWSYKLSPWIGSELLRDCFLLATRARELDMRASPYDLSGYGYEPISIETAKGRETYKAEQERIFEAGQPLAERLLSQCRYLMAELGELSD